MDIPSLSSLDYTPYETLYKTLHSNPGLSLQETFAASSILTHLQNLNSSLSKTAQFTIHEKIGGHGLAVVLRNGASNPTILLRADMDALPVLEKTGLEYASKRMEVDGSDGMEKPVMHACGHDMHVTCLAAAAEVLAKSIELWKGTLVLVFQPNEERGAGAQAMVDGGLYDKVPVPDVVLGQHVFPVKTGTVVVRKGTMMAAADSFRITLFGRGGHGSMPHKCIDPVVLASSVVMRLQGIVSREIDPAESAVVTVGSLVAGDTENVIAETAVLKINVRSQTEETRGRVLKALERIVRAECKASRCDREPDIVETTRFPLTINDENVTEKLEGAFREQFGDRFDPDGTASNASEDVTVLATSVDKPCCYWFFGGVDEGKWDKAVKEGRVHEDIPVNHSSFFAPVIQPTMKTGVEALCVGALTFLGKKLE